MNIGEVEANFIKLVMKCLVSLSVLGACLYIIIAKGFSADVAKWAFGTAGVVIGYWLK